MKIEIDGSRARSVVDAATEYVVVAVMVLIAYSRSVASTSASCAGAGLRWGIARADASLRWSVTRASASLRWGVTRTGRTSETIGAVLTGQTARRLTRRTWHGLVGRRLDVSLVAVLLAPLVAVGTHWWTVRTVGYVQIRDWTIGTWDGTDPQTAVFLAVAVLLAAAACSVYYNSGLLPTAVLVAGPVFGVAFARYGLTLDHYGTVGLANATGIGLLLAAGFAAPIAVSGFVLGTALRRVVATLRGGNGSLSAPEGI